MRSTHPTVTALKRKLLGELAYHINTEAMTKAEMARRVGCHKQHLQDILSGDRFATLDWLMNALLALGHDLTVEIK